MELNGTEKQVKWAKDIIERREGEVRDSGLKNPAHADIIIGVLKTEMSRADEWIDTRTLSIRALMGYYKTQIIAAIKAAN